MAKRDLGQEILDGIREIKAGWGNLRTKQINAPASSRIIRHRLKHS